MQNGKPIILLDRDGVINYDSDQYIKSLDEWRPIPGSIEAIAALSKAGFKVFVVTNQSGIARGYYDIDTLAAMHKKMTELVQKEGGNIAGIRYCPHGPNDLCNCRKPKSGMLESIEMELNISFKTSPAIMVGDSKRDLEAGHKRGCSSVLVLTGKGYDTQHKKIPFPFTIYDDLASFATAIINERKIK